MDTQKTFLDVGGPLPPQLGGVVDLYKDVRDLRLQMEKQVEPIKARETELREFIISNLAKSASEGGNTGVAGQRYRAQVTVKRVPRVVDWGVLFAWIRKNDRFDMLQKRLSEAAANEWMEAEQRVLPGAEIVNVPDVSVTKV